MLKKTLINAIYTEFNKESYQSINMANIISCDLDNTIKYLKGEQFYEKY